MSIAVEEWVFKSIKLRPTTLHAEGRVILNISALKFVRGVLVSNFFHEMKGYTEAYAFGQLSYLLN